MNYFDFKKIYFLFLILFIFLSSLTGQNTFPNTIEKTENSISPKATLQDIEWITGHWKGASFGGITEEIWSPPLGPSMMGSFKLMVENEIQFYEILTITEENGTLMLRILHFDKTLTGWEERGGALEFPLLKITSNKVYFDGLTFEKINKKNIMVYVIVEQKEKGKLEMKFPYKRKSKLKNNF